MADIIINITTVEDSAAVVINEDIDGNSFRLKAAKIMCILPPSLTGNQDYVTARYKAVMINGTEVIYSFPTLRYVTKTGKVLFTYEFEGKGGLGFVRGSSSSGIGTSSSQHLVLTPTLDRVLYIKEFQLRQYSTSTTVIPADTQIVILGIRG